MLSSVVSRSCTTLVSFLFFFSTPTLVNSQYTVKNTYQGQDFVQGFSFFDQGDPTNGYVKYSDKDTSINDGRITFNNGRFQMRIDSTTVTNVNGPGRGSVRIESSATWTKGLFVADFAQLPERQCGIWPAWWTLGTSKPWPYAGEIDILEGVHENNENLASLHTGTESIISSDQSLFSGVVQTTNCDYYSSAGNGGGPVGCGILDRDLNSFGSPVGQSNARTVAMEWTSDFIKVWNFPAGSRPSDILSDSPNPSNWGTPAQQFTGSDVNIDANFDAHKMIFDTTLCGDWAGAVWQSSGCAGKTGVSSCVDYVANNPSAFRNAYWDVAMVKVFQRDSQSTSTSSSTSSTTSSSSTTTSSTTSSTSTSTSSSSTTSSTSSSTSSSSTTSSSSSSSSTSSSAISSSSSSSSTTSTSTTSSSTTFSDVTSTSNTISSGLSSTTSTSSDVGSTTSGSSQTSSTTPFSGSTSSQTSSSVTSTSTSSTSSDTISSSSTSTTSSSSTTITSSITSSSTSTLTSSSSTTTSIGPIVTDTFVLVVNFVQQQRVKRQSSQYVGFVADVGTVGSSSASFAFDSNGYLKTDQSFVSDDPASAAQNFLRTPVQPITPRFRISGGLLVRDGGSFCALGDGTIIVYDGLQNKPVDCQDFTLSAQVIGTGTSTTTGTSTSTTSSMTVSSTSSTVTSTGTSDISSTTGTSMISSTATSTTMTSSTTIADPGNAYGWGNWEQPSSILTLPTSIMTVSLSSMTPSISVGLSGSFSITPLTISTVSTDLPLSMSPTLPTDSSMPTTLTLLDSMTGYGTWSSWQTSSSTWDRWSASSSMWNSWTTTSTGQWGQWQPTPASSSAQSWSSWASKQITTTIITTYVVPRPTGYETKTITVATAYNNQATNPIIPMTTYITTCPPEWGYQGPVTVTIPVISVMSESSNKPEQWLGVDSSRIMSTTGGSWVEMNQPKSTTTMTRGDNSFAVASANPSSTFTQATWNAVNPQSYASSASNWESVKPASAGDASKTLGWETLTSQSVSPASATQAWEFWMTDTTGYVQGAAATGAATDGPGRVKIYTGEARRMMSMDTMLAGGLFVIVGLWLI